MKKTLAILAVLALTLPFTGCEKEEDNDGMIEIFAEAMNGGSKVLLDGANATWVDGEKIRINSDEATVERLGDRAYISYASPQEVNRALYPSSLNVTSWGADNVTVTFPSYYHYRTDGAGHQILDLPMAARSEGSNPLQFKHLTGALYITITNTASVPLTLQSVTVTSSNYILSGPKTVNFADIESISPQTGADRYKTISMLFDTGYTLASNESVRVMLPIMPVASDNRFNIQVKSFASGENLSYLFERWQSASEHNALPRNQLGYVPVDIAQTGTYIRTEEFLDNKLREFYVRTPLEFYLMTKAIGNGSITGEDNISILEDIDMEHFEVNTITGNGFRGIIEGNNHTITNLTINSVSVGGSYYCALFHSPSPTMLVQNIIFDNLSLKHNAPTESQLTLASLFAEYEKNFSPEATLSINNCSVRYQSVTIQNATSTIVFGGLLGMSNGSYAMVSVTDCHVNTDGIYMHGNRAINWGGLIGSTASARTLISNSSWTGDVVIEAGTNVYIGGLIGKKSSNSFSAVGCTVDGNIDVTAIRGANRYWFIGSLIGQYNTVVSVDLSGTTTNFTASLNGNGVSPIENYGTNLANLAE